MAMWFSCCLLVASNVTARPEAATVASAAASCGLREPGDTRPRIGLALGGGGARGIAHISVLAELERLQVPVDCIAGTSMGALVGGLYASGMPVEAMRELVVSTDWKRLFDDSIERPERSWRRKLDDRDALATVGIGITGRGIRLSPGLLQGERIIAMFERATLGVSATQRFDELPIPYRAVATDLNTGEAVVLDQGSLAMAMRASMSLPGVFQPVEIDGKVLLDGGLVDQVPVDVVRAMGADIVVAVDVGTPLERLDRNASLLDVVSQISGMLTTGNARRQIESLGEHDVLIVPDLADTVGTGDFGKAREALAIGDQAALAARPRLARLATTGAAYLATRSQRPVGSAQPPLVEFVRLDNTTAYADELLLSQLDIPVGEPFEADAVEARLLRLYGMGTFASITSEVVREDARTGILVRARPKPQGPNYLQLGLVHSADFAGTQETSLRAAVLFSPLSALGAEARIGVSLGSEPGLSGGYYHPLDVAGRDSLYAGLAYDNPNINLFDDAGNKVATYDVRVVGARLQMVREFGNHAAVVFGTRADKGRAVVEIGDPALQRYDFEQGGLYASASIDRLDSLFFPRRGYYVTLAYAVSRDWPGGRFDQLDLDAVAARSFGRHSIQFGARWHMTTSGELPIQDRYRLGGRTRLAGFHVNELTGQHYGVAFAGYSYQLARLQGRSALVGGTIEYGNAWEERVDIGFADGILNASAYVGFDSWIGPLLFGYGWRESADGVVFLEIGRPF